MNDDDGQRKRRKRNKNDKKKSNFTSEKPSSVEVKDSKVEAPPIERLQSNSSASTIDLGNNKQLDSLPQEQLRAISSELEAGHSEPSHSSSHTMQQKGTKPIAPPPSDDVVLDFTMDSAEEA